MEEGMEGEGDEAAEMATEQPLEDGVPDQMAEGGPPEGDLDLSGDPETDISALFAQKGKK